ncbi:hypothetical protein [Cellulosimicrobium cellulans]|uniref:hypothetical protein n=1 Tax=Cellulosimicrobium cellulans TaxID=1710 RepID=UPI000A4B7402|nr:hypothetical protein [Cellulosimicrobium cellulans]
MTSSGPGPAAVRGVRAAVSTRPRRAGVGVLLVVGALAVGTTAAGGFAPHASAGGGPERAEAGTVVATGPFDLEALSWTVMAEHDRDGLADAGADAWLVVVVSALGTDRESRRLDDAAVTLPDDLPDGLELAADTAPDRPERTLLVRDASPFPVLHPGLAEDVALLWPVTGAGGATSGGSLTVTVPRFEYRDMTIGGGRRWAETGSVVQVPVAPGALPETLVEPEDEDLADDLFAEPAS